MARLARTALLLRAVLGEEPWRTGLQGTHYWDCNGQGCDATTLQPFDQKRYVAAPQYSPLDPKDHGGPMYDERLWLTGAASDGLAESMGPDSGCCGSDTKSGGCGRCLLVRNPTAENADWTAVVMKKSRCPPESKGCELPKVHLDIAAPGYDNVSVSTANICGKEGYKTYLNATQSGVCAGTHSGCACAGLPNGTAEELLLLKGCLLFGSWGWQRGDPELLWKPIACPPLFEAYIAGSFTKAGVVPVSRRKIWPWVAVAVALVLLALGACVVMRLLDSRREAQAKARQRLRKQQRSERPRHFGGSSDGSSSDSSSSTSGSD